MKSLQLTALCALACASILASGCGPSRPKELPKTYPLSVVVTQEGTPMPNVTISLYSADAQGKWTPSGLTDETGKAAIKTVCGTYIAKGAPEGEYQVLLTAQANTSGAKKLTEHDMRNMSEEERKAATKSRDEYIKAREAAQVFPKEFSKIDKTPFKVTVSQGKSVEEIDVGKIEK